MLMINQRADKPDEEQTIPLCELKLDGFEPCIIFGTQGEYDRYMGACEMVKETGWVQYMAQQWQLFHEDKILDISNSIPCRAHHLGSMYNDPEYWYNFHCEETDIKSVLKPQD